MLVKELIKRKRDGGKLSPEEIRFLVEGFLRGEVPDYQMSAFLMAVYFSGLDDEETLALTSSMLESGEKITIPGERIVDKHSTGGVGDKVSFVIAPVLAELGFRVLMLSGRALGFTGGTVDKLESTRMKVTLDREEIRGVVEKFGFSISAQTESIAPADRRIYSLRDATATVESIPLIVSSILSKKLAVNTSSIVFDVKVGTGAFMKNMEDALSLARKLVDVAVLYGRRAGAILTEMSQPLGRYAGNALEILEVLSALSGNIEEDLLEVSTAVIGVLFELEGEGDYEEGKRKAREVILSGKAYDRFCAWVRHMGGTLDLEIAERVEVLSDRTGYVSGMDGERLGYLIVEMGGGRRRVGDPVDHSVGLGFFKKIGDFVEEGEPLGEIYYRGDPDGIVEVFRSAYSISPYPVEKPQIVKTVIKRLP